MKRTVFWTLAVVNVLLLVTLLAPYVEQNEAIAQPAGRGGGRRPDIFMIPGQVVGQSSSVVYLVDTANQQLGAVSLNQKGNGLDVLQPQPLGRVFEEGPGGPVVPPRQGGRDKNK